MANWDAPAENHGSCVHQLGLDLRLMNPATMIPCRCVLQWDVPAVNHGSCVFISLDWVFVLMNKTTMTPHSELKADKGSQWSVLVPSAALHNYREMPTDFIDSASKPDSTRPCRNPGNIAMLLQLSGNGGIKVRFRRLNNRNLWLREGTLTENTPALQVIGSLVLG